MFRPLDVQNPRWINSEQSEIEAVVDGKLSTVPIAPGNIHYDWIISQGMTIAPYVHVDAAPAELTKFQFVKQLKAINKLTQIKTFILGLAEDHEARLEWDYTDKIKIDGPLISAVKVELTLTDQQVETFFINAGAF